MSMDPRVLAEMQRQAQATFNPPPAPDPQTEQLDRLRGLQDQQAAAPQAQGPDIAGFLGRYGQQLLQDLGAIFTVPGQAVLSALDRGDPGSTLNSYQQAFANQSPAAGQAQVQQALGQPVDSGTQAQQDAMGEAGRAVGEQTTNPWNWIGSGVAQGAARAGAEAATAAKLPQVLPMVLEALATGADAVNMAPAETGKFVGKALAAGPLSLAKIPGTGLGQTVRDAGQLLEQSAAGTPVFSSQARPATSLYDLLTSTYAGSLQKQFAQHLGNGFQRIMGRGTDLGQELADLTSAQAGELLPKYQRGTAGLGTLLDAETKLYDAVGQLQNPYAKLQGLQLINAAEQQNVQFADQLLSEAKQAAEGLKGREAQAVYAGMYQKLWEQQILTTQAAQDSVLRASRLVPDIGPSQTDGAQRVLGQAITPLIDDALQQMQVARVNGLGDLAGLYRPKTGAAGAGGKAMAFDTSLADQLNTWRGQAQQISDIASSVPERLGQMFGPETQQVIPSLQSADNMLRQRLGELGNLQQGIPGSLFGLHDLESAAVAKALLPGQTGGQSILATHLDTIQKSRQTLEAGVQELARASGRPYAPFNPGFGEGQTPPTSQNWLSHLNTALQDMAPSQPLTQQALAQSGPAQSAQDLYARFLQDKISVPAQRDVLAALHRYPAGDLLTTNPLLLAQQKVVNDYGVGLGLQPNKVLDSLSFLNNLWKEGLSVGKGAGRPMMYALSAIMQTLLEGENPVPMALASLQAVPAGVREGLGGAAYQGPSTVLNQMKALGIQQAPMGVTRAVGGLPQEINPGRAVSKTGISSFNRLGAVPMGVGGAVLGGLSGAVGAPEDSSPAERWGDAALGAGTGAAVGASLPLASRFLLQHLGGALEDATRLTNYGQELTRQAAQNRDLPGQLAHEALTTPQLSLDYIPGASGLGLRSAPRPVTIPPETLAKYRQLIDAHGGSIAPDVLHDLLKEAGASPQAAAQAANTWQQTVNEMSGQAVARSKQINFDTTDLNNLEQAVKTFYPFSSWSMKALPFYAQHVLENPLIVNAIVQLEQESARQKTEGGLSDRFAGTLHIPGVSDAADQLWSGVLGRPVKTYFNPLNGLVPFQDIADLGLSPSDESPPAALLRYTHALGLPALSPITGAPARAGLNDSSAHWIGPAGQVQGATAALGLNRGRGLDLGAAPTAAELAIRGVLNKAVGAESPPDERRQAIMKRLDEMLVDTTAGQGAPEGAAIRAPFEQAKLDQRGRLWDQAARDVAQQQGLDALAGSTLGTMAPAAVLGSEEERIRGASLPIMPPNQQQQLAYDAVNHPNAPVQPATVAAVAQASRQLMPAGQPLPPIVEKYLAAPTAANVRQVLTWVEQERTNRNPLASGYGQSGSPEEQRLQVLLGTYHNIPQQLMSDPLFRGVDSQTLGTLGEQARQRSLMQMVAPQLVQMLDQTPNPQTRLVKYIQDRQENFAKSEPMLQSYLAYQAQHSQTGRPSQPYFAPASTGSLQDFIRNHWLKGQQPNAPR